MDIVKIIKDLCTPAQVYFFLVSISTIVYIYHMLDPRINSEYTILGLIFSVLFYVFWTWVLNSICNAKYLKRKFGPNSGKYVSWGIVILPFLLLALALYYMYNNAMLIVINEDLEKESQMNTNNNKQ
tara:strand:+ start:1678 stop:2058 length:381 start_codon:yes stop_codon:yes gene_type:complete